MSVASMKKSFLVLLTIVAAFCPRSLPADYDPPTFTDIAVQSTAIVDATVTSHREDGDVTLDIHGHLKGKDAPRIIRGIWLGCGPERGMQAELLKRNRRYVICLIRDRLFESATFYSVRKTSDGDLQCHYQDAWYRKPPEWISFDELRQRLFQARRNSIIQDVVDIPELQFPLGWLGESQFDITKRPFSLSGTQADFVLEHLEDMPPPRTVPQLVREFRRTAAGIERKRNNEAPAAFEARQKRLDALIFVLAETQDVRSALVFGEHTSRPGEKPSIVSQRVQAVLKDSFQIDQDWWPNFRRLSAELDAVEQANPLPASRFTPDQALLAYADDKWLVWNLRDRFGDPMRHVVRYRTRYFRQRIGSGKVDLVYSTNSGHEKQVTAVLDDGTLILGNTEQLEWVHPNGDVKLKVLAFPGPPAISHTVRGVPGGLLVQRRLRPGRTLYHVPFQGSSVDLTQRLMLGSTQDNYDIVRGFDGHFRQSGHTLVWMGTGNGQDVWQFHVLNLKTRKSRTVPPSKPGRLMAISDDAFLMSGTNEYRLVSADDGSTISVTTDPDVCYERIFAVRNQIGYYLAGAGFQGRDLRELPPPVSGPYGERPSRSAKDGNVRKLVLTAIDLSATGGGRKRKLMDIPVTVAWLHQNNPFLTPFAPGLVTETGLRMWHEGKWEDIAWLRSMDDTVSASTSDAGTRDISP